VNQTMQFYRGQQGGSQPARLFLSGGASIMPYTAQFFAEKLNVPVEYFNPFRNVQIDPAVNLEDLARVAHSMGEVVGLGLRNLAHCPVELNLMPESTRKWRDFNEKKPYLIATVFTMVAVVAVLGLLFAQLGSVKAAKLAAITPKVAAAAARDQQFTSAYNEFKAERGRLDKLGALTADRYYWADTLPEFRKVLMRVEEVTSNKWQAAAGVWIEQFVTPTTPDGVVDTQSGQYANSVQGVGGMMEAAIEQKYNLAVPVAGAEAGAAAAPPTPGVSTIFMVCRAIKGPNDSANSELMYALLDNLKASKIVDPKATQVGERLISDDSKYTFTFAVKVALKDPLKF
jgi:type IV pilus assembly protein PilM